MEELTTLSKIAVALGSVLGGVFGGLVVALVARRTKRLELIYAKKADAYHAFLEVASVVTYGNDINYDLSQEFRTAWLAARLVASKEVERALTDRNGIHRAILELRMALQASIEREQIRGGAVTIALDRVVTAMNADLRRQL